MDTRRYMKKKTVAAIAACVSVIVFGLAVKGVAYFIRGSLVEVVATCFVFDMAPLALLTYIALTQESAFYKPMDKKRAMAYTICAFMLLFGIGAFGLAALSVKIGSIAQALAILAPFALPSLAVAAYLAITEPDRTKHLAAKRLQEDFYNPLDFSSSGAQAKFGLYSGALWIGAVALFVLLGMLFGFEYSWAVLPGAVIIEMLLLASMAGK